MKIELTPQQKSDQAAFRTFVQEEIIPEANRYDQEEYTPTELINKLARQGYLGSLVAVESGGSAMDMITFGLLHEEIGRGCSSIRSLLTVHSMVTHALLRGGRTQHKAFWRPKLATGEIIGAFALSEPNVGRDAKSVETTASLCGGD